MVLWFLVLMISGVFSILNTPVVVKAVNPYFAVRYLIGTVNWFLLIAVLLIMVGFRESHRLAAAYGLAVTGTMTLTGIMMTWIFYLKGHWVKILVSILYRQDNVYQ